MVHEHPIEEQGISSPRRRILLTGDGSFLAHMSRLVEVGRVLRDQHGHEVVFAASGGFAWLPEKAGFPVHPIWTAPGEATLSIVARAGLVHPGEVYPLIHAGLQDDLRVLDLVQPDLVVADMRWTAHLATELKDVPYATICNGFWTRFSTTPFPALPNHVTTRVLGEPMAARLVAASQGTITRWASKAYQQLRTHHGLAPTGTRDIYDIIEADLVLLADIPEFAATHGLPDHYHYVGPILWESDWANWQPEPWFHRLDGSRPVVYVTVGSTGARELFGEVVRRFGNTDVLVVMTTAGRVDVSGAPENIICVDYAPGRLVMERSDVVVCHGGNGTMNQAILAGCPVVGLPEHVDQALNLERARELGWARSLQRTRNLGERLELAVRTVISTPSYRASVRRLQEAAGRWDGPRMAAERLSAFVGALPARAVA